MSWSNKLQLCCVTVRTLLEGGLELSYIELVKLFRVSRKYQFNSCWSTIVLYKVPSCTLLVLASTSLVFVIVTAKHALAVICPKCPSMNSVSLNIQLVILGGLWEGHRQTCLKSELELHWRAAETFWIVVVKTCTSWELKCQRKTLVLDQDNMGWLQKFPERL